VLSAQAVIPCSALLFDLDGLMVDSEPVWFEVQRAFIRARGGEWTDELARRCVGGGLTNALRIMGEAYGFTPDLALHSQAMVDAFIERVEAIALKPGCRELVEAARARLLPCAVASSSTRRLVEATLARFGLLDGFGAVVTGDSVANAKPAPDIFLRAASLLGVPPYACVVLEDSILGVRAARAAGMAVIAVPEHRGEFPKFAAEANAVVGDLHAARVLLAM
jgi:HAD superfamily hydrolase (TIGR01509 family)